jgi:transposase
MDGIGRRADGRRVFTAEFKREQIARIQRNEITAGELARELQVQPGLIRHWKRLVTHGSETAVAANENVVPASELRVAEQRIRELERALGRKEMELEILRAAQTEVKRRPRCYGASGT